MATTLSEKIMLRVKPDTGKKLEAIAQRFGIELATLVRFSCYRLIDEFEKAEPSDDLLFFKFMSACTHYRSRDFELLGKPEKTVDDLLRKLDALEAVDRTMMSE